jgi:hypothetical protein
MDSSKELTKKAVALSILILLVQVIIYFRIYITSNLSIAGEWLIPLVSFVLAILVGWIFYEQAQKNNRARDQFIEIATHKFRTPLAVIGWSADAFETTIDISQRREEVKKIRNSLKKLQEIIDILVGATEAKDSIFYHFETTNLRQIIESSLKETLRKEIDEKEISLSISLPAKMPFVYADAKRIEFVFKTILENALAYTPKGGKITISSMEGSDTFTIKFKDTGIGLERKDMRLIFSNFYRSKDAKLSDTEGMGLELSVSKRIIEKHGGRIWAESPGKNKGATFFVEFKTDEFKQVV